MFDDATKVVEVNVFAGRGDFPEVAAIAGGRVVWAAVSGCAIQVALAIDGDVCSGPPTIGAGYTVCVDDGSSKIVEVFVDAGFCDFPDHARVGVAFGVGSTFGGGSIHVARAIEGDACLGPKTVGALDAVGV